MIRLPEDPVVRLVLRILLWLPVTFGLWFFLATALTWPLTLLTEWLTGGLFPRVIASVDQNWHRLDVVTRFALVTPGGGTGWLSFEIDPLSYGYGMPLFSALILATPGNEKRAWRCWLLGMLVLLLAQTWGVCFDILTHLAMTLGEPVSRHMGFSDLQREVIALGYQFGYLMLPPLTPVVLWILMHRRFIATLVRWRTTAAATARGLIP